MAMTGSVGGAPPDRPLPRLQGDAEPFWRGCREHRLLAQTCTGCGEVFLPPRSLCPSCLAADLQWVELGGRGEIYSFSVVSAGATTYFSQEIPYVCALVTLDEGPRFFTNIVDSEPEQLELGAKVEVVFEDVDESLALPKFRVMREGA